MSAPAWLVNRISPMGNRTHGTDQQRRGVTRGGGSREAFQVGLYELMSRVAPDQVLPKERLAIQNGFERFWASGGFPEVAGIDRRLRVMVHQEYLSTVLFRDLVERHNVSHPQAVVDLTHRLIDNVASLQSVNALTGYLKSLGHKISRTTVTDYLAWLEDAYFMYQVRLFDASLARSLANPKKIYCVDHALAVSVGSGNLVNSGHLLENLVFTALRRLTPELFYYRTRTGKEVDFLAQLPGQRRMLVQVCESLVDPRTRSRELTALSEAMTELTVAEGAIVTRNEDERVNVSGGTVSIVPAWRLLLTLSAAQEMNQSPADH